VREQTVFGEDVDELLDLMANHRSLDPHQPEPGIVTFTIDMPNGRRSLLRAIMRAEAELLLVDAAPPDDELLDRTHDQRAFDAWLLVMRE
jgi:hypothetical protein